MLDSLTPFLSLAPSSLLTPRRWDLAVKWRFFRHLIQSHDPDSERVYRWHIETRQKANARVGVGMDSKNGTDHYVSDCRRLLASMRNLGFRPQYAIPIDPSGELLGGAHRLACALALKLDEIPVKDEARRVWAPAWDEAWFLDNDMARADLCRLRQDWQRLNS